MITPTGRINTSNDLSMMRQFTRKGTMQPGNLNLTNQLDNSKDLSKLDASKNNKRQPKQITLPPLDIIDEEKTPENSSTDRSPRTSPAQTEHSARPHLRHRHRRARRHVQRDLSRQTPHHLRLAQRRQTEGPEGLRARPAEEDGRHSEVFEERPQRQADRTAIRQALQKERIEER